jgi:hypothetical protein
MKKKNNYKTYLLRKIMRSHPYGLRALDYEQIQELAEEVLKLAFMPEEAWDAAYAANFRYWGYENGRTMVIDVSGYPTHVLVADHFY